MAILSRELPRILRKARERTFTYYHVNLKKKKNKTNPKPTVRFLESI